jgi:hypothetical protein
MVYYEDYARLKAECQARQAENSVLAVECDSLKAEVERLTFDPLTYLDDSGEWMPRHTHLAAVERLKAEVERLTSDLQMEKENEDRLVRLHQDARNEVERLQSIHSIDSIGIEQLKAEVERLSKAGDKMIEVTYIKGIAGINRGVQS